MLELFSAAPALLQQRLGWDMSGRFLELWGFKDNRAKKPLNSLLQRTASAVSSSLGRGAPARGAVRLEGRRGLSGVVRAATALDAHLFVAAGRRAAADIRAALAARPGAPHGADGAARVDAFASALEAYAALLPSVNESAALVAAARAGERCANPCCRTLSAADKRTLKHGAAKSIKAACA